MKSIGFDSETALNVLKKQGTLVVDMMEAFNRDNVSELIYADETAVLLKHQCGVSMLWSDSARAGLNALKDSGITFCVAHGKHAMEAISSLGFVVEEGCMQYCRYSKQKLPLRGVCGIRPLTMDDAPIVIEHYLSGADEPHMIYHAIEKGVMYAAEVGGKVAGFIGMHGDGSIGMLEVLPEYRRRGIGTELEAFMNNLHIDKGFIPYGQVYLHNSASMKMQDSIGMDYSSDSIYWAYLPEDDDKQTEA